MKKAFSRKNLWNSTPGFLKSSVGRALGVIPPQWLFGKRFRQQCTFLRESQWWSIDQIRTYQLQKMRAVLLLSYEKTKFYKSLFDQTGFHPNDFRCLEDMHHVPIIDKSMIIDNVFDMCTQSVKDRDVDFGSTGGTSGMPLHFYLNANRSAVEYAHLTQSWGRVGYHLGIPMAVFRGRVVATGRCGLHHEYDPNLRHHYYSSFHMSPENMRCYLDHISTIGPCYLYVYPSTISTLARFVVWNQISVPVNIQGIIAGSEILYPKQRETVEKIFGCRIYSSYGHSEKLVLAAGCETSNDYHVWPTYGYFELLDAKGVPITTPGEQGEIVGTGFMNSVMPFIRYRTGDFATYLGNQCDACGRKHIIISDIRGHRTQEVLIAADGSEISWTAMNMHDDTFLNVNQFQFAQYQPGYAVLRVVPADDFDQHDIERIEINMKQKLGGQLDFTVEKVKDIPLSPRGKAIYVDQHIERDSYQ